MKLIPRGKRSNGETRYVVVSHVRDKSIEKIETNIKRYLYDMQHPLEGKRTQYQAICRYNSFVVGIHEYYSLATKVCDDFGPVALAVHKSLKARFRKKVKTAKQAKKKNLPCDIPKYVAEKYGKSKQMRYIEGHAVVPIGYIRHSPPKSMNRKVNSYTVEGRELIHKRLQGINMEFLHYLMRNPVLSQTIEYNDNRLSLYSAQKGKCAISGVELTLENIYCHHRISKRCGGGDNYQNLILVTKDVHKLIHSTNVEMVEVAVSKMNLEAKQLKRLEKLRKFAEC